jgi:cell division cycle 14
MLIGAYQVIILGRKANEVIERFSDFPKFLPFRDASEGECSYECTILDCLRGLERAIDLGWFAFDTFNCLEYETRQRMDRGDMNWIISGKILAMSSPGPKMVDARGFRVYTPEDYLPIFRRYNVSCVIRLNEAEYDR